MQKLTAKTNKKLRAITGDILEATFTCKQVKELIFDRGLPTTTIKNEDVFIIDGLIVGVLFKLHNTQVIKAEPVVWDIANNFVAPPNKVEFGNGVKYSGTVGGYQKLPVEFKNEYNNLAINQGYIEDFKSVFLNRYVLEYFINKTVFPSTEGIHVARIIIELDENSNGNYNLFQGLKTRPHPEPQTNDDLDRTAYEFGPICPPPWKNNILFYVTNGGITQYLTMDKLAEPFGLELNSNKRLK
jgi:hypothetical protein